MGGNQQHHQHQDLPPCAKGAMGAPGEEARPGTWVMGAPVPPHAHPANQQAAAWVASSDPAYTGYPCAVNTPPPVHGGASAPSSSAYGGNPYVHVAPAPTSPGKGSMDTFLKALGRCGKKLEDTTRKAGGAAGNIWHHRNLASV